MQSNLIQLDSDLKEITMFSIERGNITALYLLLYFIDLKILWQAWSIAIRRRMITYEWATMSLLFDLTKIHLSLMYQKYLIEISAQRKKSEIWKWSTTTHSCIIISYHNFLFLSFVTTLRYGEFFETESFENILYYLLYSQFRVYLQNQNI